MKRLHEPLVAQQFQADLTEKLETTTQSDEADIINAQWQHLKAAMQSATVAVCPRNNLRPDTCWISSRSVNLIDLIIRSVKYISEF